MSREQDIAFPSREDIIRVRHACGLTQEEVAYEAGVSVRTVRSLEANGDPKASTLAAVVRALYESQAEVADDESELFESWTDAKKPN